MSKSTRADETGDHGKKWFTTTHWSVVLAAGQGNSARTEQALQKLCSTYWYPLYAFLRSRGHSAHDAQDLTQGVFERLIKNKETALAQVNPAKGKFRSFLLAVAKYHASDAQDKMNAIKRGGEATVISLDEQAAEERFSREPAHEMTPEKIFERRWALTVLEQARGRLEEEYSKLGKSGLYDRLKPFQAGDRSAPPYAQVAADLGLSESGVKSAVFRLRRRYRELVREEVANTVDSPAEIDGEIRYLISVISG
jgi:RNA polymerase sigma-70 factor (ECF subfamily)